MLGRPPCPVNPNTTRANRVGTTDNHVRRNVQVTAHAVFHARRNCGLPVLFPSQRAIKRRARIVEIPEAKFEASVTGLQFSSRRSWLESRFFLQGMRTERLGVIRDSGGQQSCPGV